MDCERAFMCSHGGRLGLIPNSKLPRQLDSKARSNRIASLSIRKHIRSKRFIHLEPDGES